MIELADNSLVTPGVFAENELDIVKRGREYGYNLSGPEARCVYAFETGESRYTGDFGRPHDTVADLNILIGKVLAFLRWLAEGVGRFEWDKDERKLTLVPT